MLAIVLAMRGDPVDLISVSVEIIESIKEGEASDEQQTDRHTQGESKDIQDGKEFILCQVPYGRSEIVGRRARLAILDCFEQD